MCKRGDSYVQNPRQSCHPVIVVLDVVVSISTCYAEVASLGNVATLLCSLRCAILSLTLLFLRFAPHFVWHQSQEEKIHLIFVLILIILVLIVLILILVILIFLERFLLD